MKITYKQNGENQELEIKKFYFSQRAFLHKHPECEINHCSRFYCRVFRAISLHGLKFNELKCEYKKFSWASTGPTSLWLVYS